MPILNPYALDSNLPFSEYIAHCRTFITERRLQIACQQDNMAPIQFDRTIEANCPYELYPTHAGSGRLTYGVLLIHGLLDCPFSLKDIGLQLQQQGILARAILLPGHGTVPNDLLHVTYQDWVDTVRYGVETLRHHVEHIFLIGYSTGAALSIYHAMQDPCIAGLVLLSPAIKIKAPVSLMIGWHQFLKWISHSKKEWLCWEKETDYAKYISIPFNAVTQVAKLTKLIHQQNQLQPLATPLCMVISDEDETVSSARAMHFFSSLANQRNRLLFYTSSPSSIADSRIITRQSSYPDLNIAHLSHVGLPFSPLNTHYGEKGDYRVYSDDYPYLCGAYNRVERKLYALLYQLGLVKKIRRELRYNPDFTFMANTISQFILNKK